jgi:hypothetical protein
MGQYIGIVKLGESLKVPILVRGGGAPVNGDALPTFRTYGASGVMSNGTGTTAFKDTGSITGATNASPIVITSSSHGLTTGARVTITGVGGNTAANGTFVVTRVDANTFSLQGSTGNGAYTSGGTWNVSGLYQATVSVTGANGYEAGQNYFVHVVCAISGTAWGDTYGFTVV